MSQNAQILLDDARSGHERLLVFARPIRTIAAWDAAQVPAAFAGMEDARAGGCYVAGYMAYELGYVLEPRLAAHLPRERTVPLLWFGVFEDCEECIGPEALRDLQRRISGRGYAGPLDPEWNAAAYRARFARVHAYIGEGDIYQANLSFRSRFAFAGDPLALYLRLRAQSGAACGAFIDDGERHILSLSPELFFEISAGQTVTARPMKGTMARGADARADAAARAALAQSEKDRAENLMIVDLLRNDLGRIAQLGSVSVRDLFSVETYPTLHQMVSTVTARLATTDIGTIVRALFPCGSVTGAPKIRAMEIIRELEQSPRGIYCGAIGFFAPDGRARFNVAIRTLTISGARGELGIGGAVVQDSRPESEYDECLLKAQYFVAVRRPLDLIETFAFLPQAGFVRLERHLARMAASAARLGIPFDPAAANAMLRKNEPAVPSRMRVRLAEDGGLSVNSTPLEPAPAAWRYVISPRRLSSGDELLRHKTGWREMFEAEWAGSGGACDEIVFLNERGEVTEGSRSNIFLRRNGMLLTPPLSSGLLNGCLRDELMAQGRCREAVLTPHDLAAANDVYFGNSLRGLVRAVAAQAPAFAAG